jgi:DNA-3-methyladenine glycosylase II
LSAASEALAASDPAMASLVEQLGELGPPMDLGDVYSSLVRGIVGQQLSVIAARAIHGRLLARYGGRVPTPAEILAEDDDDFRAAVGLSHAKVRYLRSLAEHQLAGELDDERLAAMSDEEVVRTVTAVQGIGPWSADMLLMFTLHRPDVLASGDLGIRRAVERLYGLPGLPSIREVEAIGERWRPHRTLACRYLWTSLANAPI